MSRAEHRLIIIVALLFFLGSLAYSNRCNQVYVCCKKVDFDCVEYCGPTEECPDQIFDAGELKNDTLKGNDTQVLNVKLCRKGTRLVNGLCKRVL